MAYRTVLLDLDHTIFDFDGSEQLAFAAALDAAGLSDHDDGTYFPTYHRLNTALWAAAERGEIRTSEIRNLRFAQLLRELDLDADERTVVAMADAFVHGLGAFGDLYPGARDLVDALADRVTLGLVSNGLGEVVRARLDRLAIAERFDAVVVSSEVGATKPDPTIFDAAFAALGSPPKATAVMVGDSLSSDIAGGAAYGIATCWYNPHQHPAPPRPPTHEITTLHDLLSMV